MKYLLKLWSNGQDHFLGLLIFIFLVFPRYSTFAILAWVIQILIYGFRKKFSFRSNKYMLLWIVLYLLYLIGSFFTNHPDIAGKYLEYKLAFAIFPLLFFLTNKISLKLSTLVGWGIMGTVVLLILSFLNSYKCGTETTCWISSSFSYVHHPTYFAQYLTFFFYASIYGYREKWNGYRWPLVLVYCILSLIGIVLCFSFAGIITFFVTSIIVLFYAIWKKYSFYVAAASSLVFGILSILFLMNAPQIKDDWFTVKKITTNYVASPSQFIKSRAYPLSGTEVRLVMWTAAVHTIAEFPFGVGTGNVDENLSKSLIKLNQIELAKENYNPHNQFLQTGVELGIVSMIFLIAFFSILMWHAIKTKNYLLFLLIFTLFVNCFFESMLQRQSGIIFNCFWSCLLIVVSFQSKEKKEIVI